MDHDTVNNCFIEISYPDLVKDTQKIFYDYIFPCAVPRGEIYNSLRYLAIKDLEDNNPIKLLTEKDVFLSEQLLVF
jgi:hypothetical protein